MTPPSDGRLLVVAIGGRVLRNAAGGSGTTADWVRTLDRVLPPLADLLARGFRLVVTHGSAARGEDPGARTGPTPLDLDGAGRQGALGYAIQQALGTLCRARELEVPLVTLVTRVVVDPGDPAFHRPATPVGAFYTAAQARALVRKRGWTLVQDSARGFRRVVPSLRPVRVVELDAIRRLSEGGAVAIACGGGGIPVVDTPGGYRAVEAVVDPDLATEALATALAADRLLLLTAVERAVVNHGTLQELAVERLTPDEARALLSAGEFPPTSMGPKIEAALRFVEAGGREAIITSLDRACAAVDGEAGTHLQA